LASTHPGPEHGGAPRRSQFGWERTPGGLHEFLFAGIADLPRTGGVLDLGAGTGAWLKRLRSEGFEDCVGIEGYVEPLRDDDDLTSGIIAADLGDPTLDLGRQFGLITCIEVIEHLYNPGNLLALIGRHLAPGGVALITTPNIQSLAQRLKFALTGRFAHFEPRNGSDPTHVQPLLLETWTGMLPGNGLRLAEHSTFPPRTPGPTAGRLLTVATAVLSPVLKDALPGETLILRLAAQEIRPARQAERRHQQAAE
jgi:SAM-dependent methyltransferase